MKDLNYRVDVDEIKKIMIDMRINTILELSKRTGINRNTLSDVLNGKIKPSSDTMYKLVDCLSISPSKAGEIFFKVNLRNAKEISYRKG